MKTGYGIAVTTDVRQIFGGDESCSAFKIGNRTTSTNDLLVNIPVLHGRDWFPIFPGGEEPFATDGLNGITEVNVKSVGDSTIDFGVTQRTDN